MIALIKHRDGTVQVAEQQWIGKLQVWKTIDGLIWLKSWAQVVEEVASLDMAKLDYPEYFI